MQHPIGKIWTMYLWHMLNKIKNPDWAVHTILQHRNLIFLLNLPSVPVPFSKLRTTEPQKSFTYTSTVMDTQKVNCYATPKPKGNALNQKSNIPTIITLEARLRYPIEMSRDM